MSVRIMIAEDEEIMRITVADHLRSEGWQVDEVSGGNEALALLQKQSYDIIVSDIRMPGMDGIETLKKIKAAYPLVEVILLTGHGSTETAVDGMKSGAFDYLMKPADFDDITAKITGACQRKTEQEERIRKAEARLLLRRSGDI